MKQEKKTQKEEHDRHMEIFQKCKNGTANFQERTIMRILQKKMRKSNKQSIFLTIEV